jgi:hypothetical protein
MTKHQAVHIWHYFNGDQDNDPSDDEDELNASDSSTEFRACQSDTDEECQPDPYKL